jgi:hypothetical protein
MPMSKPKYSTITELAAAFKSGELDSTYHLVIDKGGCLAFAAFLILVALAICYHIGILNILLTMGFVSP